MGDELQLNGLGKQLLPEAVARTASCTSELLRSLLAGVAALTETSTVLGALRLQISDVLVELGALRRGQDVAHRGDPLLEALLELGATCSHAGGVATLTPRTRRVV